jgi:hypothetical protein
VVRDHLGHDIGMKKAPIIRDHHIGARRTLVVRDHPETDIELRRAPYIKGASWWLETDGGRIWWH